MPLPFLWLGSRERPEFTGSTGEHQDLLQLPQKQRGGCDAGFQQSGGTDASCLMALWLRTRGCTQDPHAVGFDGSAQHRSQTQ